MYRIGLRGSRLSRIQAQNLMARLDVKYDFIYYETKGDKDKATPIDRVENTDFFTDTIDRALIAGKIDFAVHSAKDLPDELLPELCVAFKSAAPDVTDSLVSALSEGLYALRRGSVVGTSSFRRKEQLLRLRNDLVTKPIRGTIEERLQKLNNGDYDAIIVATVAMKRLGLENLITEVLPIDIFEPHPDQGCLAVVALKNRPDIKKLFVALAGERI